MREGREVVACSQSAQRGCVQRAAALRLPCRSLKKRRNTQTHVHCSAHTHVHTRTHTRGAGALRLPKSDINHTHGRYYKSYTHSRVIWPGHYLCGRFNSGNSLMDRKRNLQRLHASINDSSGIVQMCLLSVYKCQKYVPTGLPIKPCG